MSLRLPASAVGVPNPRAFSENQYLQHNRCHLHSEGRVLRVHSYCAHDAAVDPPQLRALLEGASVTMMQAPPTTWRLLLDAGWTGHASFRMDTEYPPSTPKRLLLDASRDALELKRFFENCARWAMSAARDWTAIGEKLSERSAKAKSKSRQERRHLDRVEGRFVSLSYRYRVAPYSGTVYLLVSEERQRQFENLGWPISEGDARARRTGRLVLVVIKGDHVSRLTTYGKSTGETITRIMEEPTTLQ